MIRVKASVSYLLIVLSIVLYAVSVPVHAGSIDLAVVNVWLEKASVPGVPVTGTDLSSNESFNIVASITNLGQQMANGYYLDAYYDSGYGRGGPDDIASGQVQEWYIGPFTALGGQHTTHWVVNPDLQIPEVNTANNAEQYTFNIGQLTTNSTTTVSSTSTNTTASSSTVPVTTASSTTQSSTTSSTMTTTASSTTQNSMSTTSTSTSTNLMTTMTTGSSTTLANTTTASSSLASATTATETSLGTTITTSSSTMRQITMFWTVTALPQTVTQTVTQPAVTVTVTGQSGTTSSRITTTTQTARTVISTHSTTRKCIGGKRCNSEVQPLSEVPVPEFNGAAIAAVLLLVTAIFMRRRRNY